MKKSIILAFIVLSILAVCCSLEQYYIKKEFSDFEEVIASAYDKVEDGEANVEDIIMVQKWWQEKKRTLHIYIPHTAIEDVDYWLGEAISLVQTNNFDIALSKLQVLKEIAQQIPDTFSIKIENIF